LSNFHPAFMARQLLSKNLITERQQRSAISAVSTPSEGG
jgi:hypothetical protein